MTTTTTTPVAAERLSRLRRYNLTAGLAHGLQAVLILVLANGFTLPVTASYVEGPPGSSNYETVVLFNTRIGLGVALFFAVSAVAHFWIVSPPGFARYGRDLARQQNIARWVEYAISSSIMIVLIAQITSVTNVLTLFTLFAVNATMILFGWLQEKYQTPGDGGWLPFIFGCIAGVVPWLCIVFLLIAPGATSAASPPKFVYAIVASLFIFFNVFALNQWLQYKQVGRWRDYLVGERAYITLSLVAKSLLAWQVFAGTLTR